MWAKILVGAFAAVAVAGGGVYLAMSDSDCHKCGGAQSSAVVSECTGCCPIDDAATGPADESACCAAKKACCSESAPTDAAAACAGPAALVSTKAPACETGACPKAGACCDEKK